MLLCLILCFLIIYPLLHLVEIFSLYVGRGSHQFTISNLRGTINMSVSRALFVKKSLSGVFGLTCLSECIDEIMKP